MLRFTYIKLYFLMTIAFLMIMPHAAFAFWPFGDDSKSGYNTQTQVVGSKYIFVRHRFVAADFQRWTALLAQAQAYEQFNMLITNGQISGQGIVQGEPVVIGNQRFDRGVGVIVEDVRTNFKPTLDNQAVLHALQSLKVVDENGYLNGVNQNANLNFDSYNFSFLLPALKTLGLPISNPVAYEELINELNALVIIKHQAIEVTTQDTTRYQSRNDNIFTGLMETIGGNALGSVLYPDKMKVDREEYAYVPRTVIALLYPQRVGFSVYPYTDRRSGLWLLNGNTANKSLFVSSATLGQASLLKAGVDMRFIPENPPYQSAFAFYKLRVDYGFLKQVGNVHYANISFGGGASSPKTLLDYSVGLGYVKIPASSALGINANLDYSWFFMPPLSLQVQTSMLATTIWSYYDIFAGLNLHLSNLVLGVGYKYYICGPENNRTQAGGLAVSGTYFF